MINGDNLEEFIEAVKELLSDTLISFEERLMNCEEGADGGEDCWADESMARFVKYNESDCELPLVTITEITVNLFIEEMMNVISLLGEEEVDGTCG